MDGAIRWELVLAVMATISAAGCGPCRDGQCTDKGHGDVVSLCPDPGQCGNLPPLLVEGQQCPDDPENTRPEKVRSLTQSQSTTTQSFSAAPDTTCGTWLCQTNAASLGDGLYFFELDLSGHNANNAGMTFVGF